jgi:hypothetical protein
MEDDILNKIQTTTARLSPPFCPVFVVPGVSGDNFSVCTDATDDSFGAKRWESDRR